MVALLEPPAVTDQTIGMVRAAVIRKLPLFAPWPDIDRDDLMQDALASVHRASAAYDGSRGSWSTFVGMVAGRRLIDIWRSLARRTTRETAYAADRHGTHHFDDDPTDTDVPLDEWLSELYGLARRHITHARYRQGRRYFNIAQVFAVGMMMESRGLSLRACRMLFLDNAALCKAVRFRHVPSHGWFQGAAQVCTDFLENLPRSKRGLARLEG